MTKLDKTIELLQTGRAMGIVGQSEAGDALANFRDALRYAVSPEFPEPADDSARMTWLRSWAEGAKLRGHL